MGYWTVLAFAAVKGLLSLFCLLAFWLYKRARVLPLPPDVGSLKGWPGYRWEIYAKRARILGPLISTSTLGTSMIILNKKQAAVDLLDKRTAFACRPRWPMAEMLGRQDNVGFTYYGERLKKLRKVLQKSLSHNVIVESWSDLLNDQSMELCRALLDCPNRFREAVEINVQELIVMFTYGYKPDAEYIQLAQTVVHQTGEALQPGRWLVNFIPALMWVPAWFPGASFQTWARKARSLFLKMTRTPFHTSKMESLESRRHVCFVRKSLSELPRRHSIEDEDVVMFAAGSLFSAGTETLTGVLHTFLGVIVAHPDVQKRAYDEILSVVGKDGLPGLQHRTSLPYIDCIIQEVHRYYPAVPLITHSNNKEDNYKGLRIPKKSWVMANVWAMLHDEEVYAEPSTFLPERFSAIDSSNVPPDPRAIIYGFGRRRCPGAHFADLYLFLMVSRILSLFEVLPTTQDGHPKPPILEFTAGIVAFPKPFTCRLVPRERAAQILEN